MIKKKKIKTYKTYKIAVTQKDIDKGIGRDSCNCPTAPAIKRALKMRGGNVVVEDKLVHFFKRHTNIDTCLLPHKAQRFIERFDNKLTVHPFTFTIKAAL